VPRVGALNDARILVVEDDVEIRGALTDLLREEGAKVTATSQGREALALLRAGAPPDVILLDLMMPVMDGWEFRVEQRKDPLLARIPVIAMSADTSAKARAIAADATVAKPIDFDELARRIRSVIDHAARMRVAPSDRMAALGRLASGIAHEINNPLTYVMANVQVLSERLPARDTTDDAETRELLSDTMDGLERIRRIVQQVQMMAPARLDEHDTLVDLEAAIEAALVLVKADIRHFTRVVRDLSGKGRVRGDRTRVEQLFAHLLRNAAQSIVEPAAPSGKGGGKCEIRVSMRALPSERALIEISDTGCGIPAELQERVFQPFFTTRPVGQGTGLGLSVCAGIVTALGGEISFESEPGRGSLFRVVVPTVALSSSEN
jgi:signal transduction histidine kinase